MQLTKSEKVFDSKKVEEVLRTENRFVSDLFSLLALPTREDDSNDDEEDDSSPAKTKFVKKKEEKTTRAKSLCELQERLQALTSSKKKLSYKEKMARKSLKSRVKKKTKQVHKLQNAPVNGKKSSKPKPVFDSEGKMVFSKFDFSNLGSKKPQNKEEKDPKKLLKRLEEQEKQLSELQDGGQVSKVVEIKEKAAWKNALAKAEGKKVRDDPVLLKKSVQRQEQKKRSSAKKWQQRLENVEKGKKERQEKRSGNIEKRKKDKKTKKLKAAVKRGKVVPGF